MANSTFTTLVPGKFIMIGRKLSDITINDIRISSVHCEVGSVKMYGWDMFPACTVYVEDKSSNGTWLCRKVGLSSWGPYSKLAKGLKMSLSPGDFILLLPPSIAAADYCAFSLEADETSNVFGLKHLTAADIKSRLDTKAGSSLVGTVSVKRTHTSPDERAKKKPCLSAPIPSVLNSDKDSPSKPVAAAVLAVPVSMSTHASMEQCPWCLGLFPVSELVEHSELCSLKALADSTDGDYLKDGPSHDALPGSSAGVIELEQCIHCLEDYTVAELVDHVNVCPMKGKSTAAVKEVEHCQHCLGLFPLDEIVSHSLTCSHKAAPTTDSSIMAGGKEELLERCMHCFRDFPISELVRHMPECTGDMCGPKDRFKGFVPSVHDIDAMAMSVLTDTQREAVDYVLQHSEADSRKVFSKLLKRVKGLGYDEKDLEKTLLWVRLSAPIIIHVHLDRVLNFLVKDTHYRNLFETRTGSGCLDTSARSSWEDRIFNNVYHNSPPFERVKYGVLNVVGDLRGVRACYSYGDSFLQLKKVRLRTTFASMDTSSGMVKLSCCEYYGNVLHEYSDPELRAIIDVATRRKDHLKSNMISNYKEIQIHGPVCLSENVECIVVNERFRGDSVIERQLEEFVMKNNCNLIWMDAC